MQFFVHSWRAQQKCVRMQKCHFKWARGFVRMFGEWFLRKGSKCEEKSAFFFSIRQPCRMNTSVWAVALNGRARKTGYVNKFSLIRCNLFVFDSICIPICPSVVLFFCFSIPFFIVVLWFGIQSLTFCCSAVQHSMGERESIGTKVLCAKYFGFFASSHWSCVLNSQNLTLSAHNEWRKERKQSASHKKKKLIPWLSGSFKRTTNSMVIITHIWENTYYRLNAPPFVTKKVKSKNCFPFLCSSLVFCRNHFLPS